LDSKAVALINLIDNLTQDFPLSIMVAKGGDMTITAFILIEVAVGKTQEVVSAVRGLAGVKEAHGVTGPYDVIVVAEVADVTAIAELVTQKIHPIPGIIKTITCLGVLG